MSKIRDRLQALHRRTANTPPDEEFDRTSALADYIAAYGVPAAPPAPTEVPAHDVPDVPVPRAASPSVESAPTGLRAKLERLHRVPSHVGPPSSFRSLPPGPSAGGRAPVTPAPARSAGTATTPRSPATAAPAAVPPSSPGPIRPVPDLLFARLAAASSGATAIAEHVAAVRATAQRPTLLGAVHLHDALDAIIALDDTKLMLPVGRRVRDAVYFDIESTGLRVEDCHAFVLGAASVRDDDVLVEQIVPLGPGAEAESLRQFTAHVADAGVLVTFNGTRFDLPFLAGRCARHGLPDPFADVVHIDLYRIARHTLRKKLHRYSLAALEKHALGMERFDDLPGREAPAAYLRFLATGDATDVARVLEHNRLDLLSMIPLLAALTSASPLPRHPASTAPLPSASRPTVPLPQAAAPRPASHTEPAAAARSEIAEPLPSEAAVDLAANGFIALGAHDHNRAIALLSSAVARGLGGPMRKRALRELGRLALARDLLEEAVEQLEAACAEPGGDAESHALLAAIYDDRLGSPGHALRHARRAVTLQPWNGPLRERLERLELRFS